MLSDKHSAKMRHSFVSGAMAFGTMTLSIIIFSIKGLFMTFSINDSQHKTLFKGPFFPEYRDLFIVTLNAILLYVDLLNVAAP
jgi:hypothetical protein